MVKKKQWDAYFPKQFIHTTIFMSPYCLDKCENFKPSVEFHCNILPLILSFSFLLSFLIYSQNIVDSWCHITFRSRKLECIPTLFFCHLSTWYPSYYIHSSP